MINKDSINHLPEKDKADLLAMLLGGADVHAKVQVMDEENTVLIPLERYEELCFSESALNIMVDAVKRDPHSHLPEDMLALFADVLKN